MVENRQDRWPGARPTLELSMIVKNGALGLARCLESVKGVVDRIVLGDTGSTDETLSIAARYGAEVVTVPWKDDFSLARNQVLGQAQCDWILMLDADEMLDPAARTQIPALLAQVSTLGFDVWRWNYVNDIGYRCNGEQAIANPMTLAEARQYPAYFRSFHTRLFRRHPGIFYEHCVHEDVCYRMDANHLRRGPGNFLIHHFGYVEDVGEGRNRKDNLYHQLSYRKLAANPKSHQAHFEAGLTELDHAKNPAAALPHFEAACSLEPRRWMGWFYAGICLSRLGRFPEAHQRLMRAAALDSTSPLLHIALADVYFHTGDFVNARRFYKKAHFLGDNSPLSWAKLGATEVQLGKGMKGVAKVQNAIQRSPDSGELYSILATAAFLAQKHHLACEAADRRLNMEGALGFHFALAASLHAFAKEPAKAAAILQTGEMRFPGNADIQAMMANPLKVN